MIIKIQKIINNKYSRLFKFVFFLRYLFFDIFSHNNPISTYTKFFDYKKKSDVIRNTLHQKLWY